MNSLRTQLRNKPPPVATLTWKFGNPLRDSQSGRKSLSRYTNAVLDTVAGACFEKPIDCQAAARSIQINGSIVNTIKTNIPQVEQGIVKKKLM